MSTQRTHTSEDRCSNQNSAVLGQQQQRESFAGREEAFASEAREAASDTESLLGGVRAPNVSAVVVEEEVSDIFTPDARTSSEPCSRPDEATIEGEPEATSEEHQGEKEEESETCDTDPVTTDVIAAAHTQTAAAADAPPAQQDEKENEDEEGAATQRTAAPPSPLGGEARVSHRGASATPARESTPESAFTAAAGVGAACTDPPATRPAVEGEKSVSSMSEAGTPPPPPYSIGDAEDEKPVASRKRSRPPATAEMGEIGVTETQALV